MNTFGSYFKTALIACGLSTAIIFGLPRNKAVDTDAMRDVSVSIRAISNVRTDLYGDSVWAPSSGSGFLVSLKTCEVWTNHHVIENSAAIEVFPRGWNRAYGIPARVINSSPQMDVAILQMENCKGAFAAKLGDSSRVKTGDETFVVGNPFGRNPDSVSRGIISHTRRYLAAPEPYFQTDAAVNPGNSGGALFDRNGAVIGLTTAIANSKSGLNVGIGYALPLRAVLKVVSELRAGPPSWGDAGLEGNLAALSVEEAAIFNVPGGGAAVSIMHTPESGPSANLTFARDIIFQIDGDPVTSPSHVDRVIGSKSPGDSVVFSLLREGERKTVEITLAEGWDKNLYVDEKAETYQGLLGMKVEMWNDDNSYRGQFDSPVITKIHSKGPAHLGYIVSSQSTLAKLGRILTPVQLTVRTVTGVVFKGKYQPIFDVPSLDEIVSQAYQSKRAILLEIESWARNPGDFNTPLQRNASAFYRIIPSPGPAGGEAGETGRTAAKTNENYASSAPHNS